MSARDNLNQTQFYHGTPAKLSPGDWITSASNRGTGKEAYNYFTSDPTQASGYAAGHTSERSPDQVGYVYKVSPSAPSEPDPKLPSDNARRSRGPLLVTGLHEVEPPDSYMERSNPGAEEPGPTGSQLAAAKRHYRKMEETYPDVTA